MELRILNTFTRTRRLDHQEPQSPENVSPAPNDNERDPRTRQCRISRETGISQAALPPDQGKPATVPPGRRQAGDCRPLGGTGN